MKRKRLRASGGVTALLAALTAAIYLFGMAAATVCTAAVLCSVFDDDTRSHLERIFLWDDDWTDEERTQYALCRLVYEGSSSRVTLSAVNGFESDRREPLRQIGLSGRRATVVFDASGNLAVESGDFLYFPYLSAASWDAGADDSADGYAYVPLAREHMHPNLLGVWEAFTWPFGYAAFRVTGQRDGAAFRAARVEAVDEHAFEVALDTLVAPETVWQPDGAAVLNSMDDSAGRIRSLRDENGRLTRSLGFAEQAERRGRNAAVCRLGHRPAREFILADDLRGRVRPGKRDRLRHAHGRVRLRRGRARDGAGRGI